MGRFLLKHWPMVGLGLLLAVVAAYLIGAKWVGRGAALLDDVVSREGVQLNEIHYTQDDPERGLRWILDAESVRFSRDQRFVHFSRFLLTVEPKEGAWVKLKGDEGDYSRDTGEIEIRGAIKGETGDGYRLLTEHLLIDEGKKTVRTDAPVQLEGPFFSVEGKGLFFDLNQERVQILSEVTTHIR